MNWITAAIERFRIPLFIFCGLVQLVAFNGQWRIGLDSSLYRGLGNSLASGRGYEFGEFASSTIYPGLPVVLAGLQKAFGLSYFSPWQSVVLMVLMAAASLVVVYHLIRLHYPIWIATTVTCGVALNSRFVQLSHELLTDIPFFLGLVTAVLGWELMHRSDTRARFIRAAVIASAGMLLAASMRPTFWVLAVAWLAVSSFELIRRRTAVAATALAIGAAVVLIVMTVDPRTRVWRVFDGGYEEEFLAILQDAGADSDTRAPGLATRLQHNIPKLLQANFAEAFLGQGVSYIFNPVISIALLAGAILIARRHPLYAILVFTTIAITLALTTTPRYYLMLLPFLLLGWIIGTLKLIGEPVSRRWQRGVLLVSLAFVTSMNIAKIVPFVIEQRKTPFLQTYKDASYLPFIAMAELIRTHVPPETRVMGPKAQVLKFLSDRQVMLQRELLPPRKSPKAYPSIISQQDVEFAVFPAEPYRDKEPELARMIDKRIIRAGETVAKSEVWRLSRVSFRMPPGSVEDWRTMPVELMKKRPPKKPKRTPEQLAATQRRLAREAKAAYAARKAAAERKALAARKAATEERRLAAARRAAAERKLAVERKLAAAERKASAERKERAARAAAKAERERKQAAAEAKARKAAKERKARKATSQPSADAGDDPLHTGGPASVCITSGLELAWLYRS